MKIESIEGIGTVYAEKLRAVGINSAEKLLEFGNTPTRRSSLAREIGVDDAKILKWVNLCDLCRIKGVSSQYSELLEAAGVDTVKELRNRNADNLYQKIRETNEHKNLVHSTPSRNNIRNWIEQAQSLSPMVNY